MTPGYNRNWPWARVEMELLPSGKVNAWMYGHLRGRSAAAGLERRTPGHDNNSAVDIRYGNWTSGPGPGRSYVTVDDEKGVATTRVYDPYGRMRRVIADSAGTSDATRNNQTSYAYDALDRLTSTTMPERGTAANPVTATSTYAYDTLGRVTSRHHPDADAATLYKYDDLGRLRFSQDARQRAAGTGSATRKVTYTVYDDFGRVTRVDEAAADFSSLDPESAYPFERDAVSWRSRITYGDNTHFQFTGHEGNSESGLDDKL